jgi:hypothetical protein
VASALDNNIPIRIGVNAGSLEKDLQKKYTEPTPTPFWRKLSDFKISNPTLISSTGSEARETRTPSCYAHSLLITGLLK